MEGISIVLLKHRRGRHDLMVPLIAAALLHLQRFWQLADFICPPESVHHGRVCMNRNAVRRLDHAVLDSHIARLRRKIPAAAVVWAAKVARIMTLNSLRTDKVPVLGINLKVVNSLAAPRAGQRLHDRPAVRRADVFTGLQITQWYIVAAIKAEDGMTRRAPDRLGRAAAPASATARSVRRIQRDLGLLETAVRTLSSTSAGSQLAIACG